MSEFKMTAEDRAKARDRYRKRREAILSRLRTRYREDETRRVKLLEKQRERYRAYRAAYDRMKAWGVAD